MCVPGGCCWWWCWTSTGHCWWVGGECVNVYGTAGGGSGWLTWIGLTRTEKEKYDSDSISVVNLRLGWSQYLRQPRDVFFMSPFCLLKKNHSAKTENIMSIIESCNDGGYWAELTCCVLCQLLYAKQQSKQKKKEVVSQAWWVTSGVLGVMCCQSYFPVLLFISQYLCHLLLGTLFISLRLLEQLDLFHQLHQLLLPSPLLLLLFLSVFLCKSPIEWEYSDVCVVCWSIKLYTSLAFVVLASLILLICSSLSLCSSDFRILER